MHEPVTVALKGRPDATWIFRPLPATRLVRTNGEARQRVLLALAGPPLKCPDLSCDSHLIRVVVPPDRKSSGLSSFVSAIAELASPGCPRPGRSCLSSLDEQAHRFEHFAVRRSFVYDHGEKLDLDALEDVADEGSESSRRQRQLRSRSAAPVARTNSSTSRHPAAASRA